MNIECYSVTVSVWVTCHHQIMETGGRSSTLWAGADLIVMKTEGLLWTKWVLPTAAEAKLRVTLSEERLKAMDFPEELA